MAYNSSAVFIERFSLSSFIYRVNERSSLTGTLHTWTNKRGSIKNTEAEEFMMNI